MKLRKRKKGELKRITQSKGVVTVVYIDKASGKKETFSRIFVKGGKYGRI